MYIPRSSYTYTPPTYTPPPITYTPATPSHHDFRSEFFITAYHPTVRFDYLGKYRFPALTDIRKNSVSPISRWVKEKSGAFNSDRAFCLDNTRYTTTCFWTEQPELSQCEEGYEMYMVANVRVGPDYLIKFEKHTFELICIPQGAD